MLSFVQAAAYACEKFTIHFISAHLRFWKPSKGAESSFACLSPTFAKGDVGEARFISSDSLVLVCLSGMLTCELGGRTVGMGIGSGANTPTPSKLNWVSDALDVRASCLSCNT